MKAIAQCGTTLELKEYSNSVTSFPKGLIAWYTWPEYSTGEVHPSQPRRRKTEVFDDLPMSHAEFEAAWVGLCAFELEGIAMLPTAPTLQGVWKSIMSAIVVKGLKFEDSIHVQDIVALVEEDGFPRSLLQAVLYRLSMDQVVPIEGCESFLDHTQIVNP